MGELTGKPFLRQTSWYMTSGMGWTSCSSPGVARQRIADDEDEVMVIRTMVVVWVLLVY